MPNKDWLDRERRTAHLVRICHQQLRRRGELSGDALHALCRLTWITKGSNGDAENVASVIAPALSEILDIDGGLAAKNAGELREELDARKAPQKMGEAIGEGVGFTNYYNAFRRTSLEWARKNRLKIDGLFSDAASVRTDADRDNVYRQIEALPRIPRKGAGGGLPGNLLTGVVACLDSAERSPIINRRASVLRLLSDLGLARANLVDQATGMRALLGRGGVHGAFALDTATDEELARLARKAPKPRPQRRKKGGSPLAILPDDDVAYLRRTETAVARRLHNTMTNRLVEICETLSLVVNAGAEKDSMFDALVLNYRGTERHLLIEAKSDTARPVCRLAVGQLLDYKHMHPDWAKIDLAVLFPEAPAERERGLFDHLGIHVMWFQGEAMASIAGNVPLDPR